MIPIDIITLLEPVFEKHKSIIEKVDKNKEYFCQAKINTDLFFQVHYYNNNLYRVSCRPYNKIKDSINITDIPLDKLSNEFLKWINYVSIYTKYISKNKTKETLNGTEVKQKNDYFWICNWKLNDIRVNLFNIITLGFIKKKR